MRNLLRFVNNRAKCAKNHKNAGRGFTLAEAAIALTVITLVTVTALSLFTASGNVTRRESAEEAALFLVSDLVECFRATDNLADFHDAVDFARNQCTVESCTHEDHAPPRWEKETKALNERYEYTLTVNPQMVVTAEIDIPEGEQTTENATLTITASYRNRDVWDTPYVFRKGVGADAQTTS